MSEYKVNDAIDRGLADVAAGRVHRMSFAEYADIPNEDKVKQVIVMRRQYTDKNGNCMGLNHGKMIAQGAHSSIAFLTNKIQSIIKEYPFTQDCPNIQGYFKDQELKWIEGAFTKICLQVQTEEELDQIYENAKKAGLEVHLITDSGLTEFHGVPTKTCLAIGPDYSSKIDPITNHLKLL